MSKPARKRWDDLFQRLGANSADAAYGDLTTQYSEPHRAYHNLRHVIHCLEEFDTARELARNPDAVELAIWYHDAIYDPHSKENETRSAELATVAIRRAGLPGEFGNKVSTLILATTKHDASLDEDASLMVDVDLSILGQRPERFDEYERQIRKEYDWVPADAFAVGRSSILKSFLNRPTIYATDFFRQKYEQPARLNLKNSLQELETQSQRLSNQV